MFHAPSIGPIWKNESLDHLMRQEVLTQAELDEAIKAGAKNILIDNFSIEKMHKAVAINQGRAVLEASGGIGIELMRAIAATGVDRISLGKLTKDVQAVDFSMRMLA